VDGPCTYHILDQRGFILRWLTNSSNLNNSTDPGEPTATTFSDIAASSENQKAFSDSLISFMTTYGFNGVEIDWYVVFNRVIRGIITYISITYVCIFLMVFSTLQGVSCSFRSKRPTRGLCKLSNLACSATECFFRCRI